MIPISVSVVGHFYYMTGENHLIFGSKRFKYFFDVKVGPRICKDNPLDGLLSDEVYNFIKSLTGQSHFNDHKVIGKPDHKGRARWGFMGIHYEEGNDKLFTLPYEKSHIRFAFVRKRDAAMFKLVYVI